jgi:excisionase family DNA binding protein
MNNHNVTSEQILVSKAEIARRYGISQRMIQDWMADGTIPYHKLGYIVRFNPQSCDQALARFKVNAIEAELP